MKNLTNKFTAAFLIWLLSIALQAQSGGDFAIKQSVIASGGGNSSGGTFAVNSTVGQPADGSGALGGGTFSLTSGFWSFATNSAAGQGLESDVADRPDGDGAIQSNDVVQVQRFQIGLDQPNQLNEFQRADSAPLVARGDGAIQSNDVVQTQRYQIGLETTQNAAGPLALGGFQFGAPPKNAEDEAAVDDSSKNPTAKIEMLSSAAPRELRVESVVGATAGQQIVVNIRADALGDETAYGFTLNYSPAVFLTAPTTAIGTAGGSRLCNTTIAGQVSCSVNNFPNDQPGSSTDQIGEILPGNNQLLLRITFTVRTDAPGGTTPLTILNVNTSNDAAQSLTVTAQSGSVTVISPTAAQVSVGGRVTNSQGRGIARARVTLTGASGAPHTAFTNAFGYFRFEEVAAGETYIVEVRHKRHQFAPQVVTVNEAISDLNFMAMP